jgi:hypothetical protein
MITLPTVFILGAGASKTYEYPTGDELRSFICGPFVHEYNLLLNPYYDEDSEGRRKLIDEAKDFVKYFKNSGNYSIDAWLAINHDFSDLGKFAIILCILMAERKSVFYTDRSFQNKKQDWYSYLFNKMIEELIEPDSFLKLFIKSTELLERAPIGIKG